MKSLFDIAMSEAMTATTVEAAVYVIEWYSTVKEHADCLTDEEFRKITVAAITTIGNLKYGDGKFVEVVLRRLRLIARNYGSHLTLRIESMFAAETKQKIAQGWSIDDIVAHMSLSEEINPSLAEEIALEEMAKIECKYTLTSTGEPTDGT